MASDRISPEQCRAARGLLKWSQRDLAREAQVSRATISDFERHVRTPIRQNMMAIMLAFGSAGLVFDRLGVRPGRRITTKGGTPCTPR